MTQPAPQFLRLPQVMQRIGLSKPSIYRLMKTGEFPKPRKLGAAAVGWRVDELDEWAASRPRAA